MTTPQPSHTDQSHRSIILTAQQPRYLPTYLGNQASTGEGKGRLKREEKDAWHPRKEAPGPKAPSPVSTSERKREKERSKINNPWPRNHCNHCNHCNHSPRTNKPKASSARAPRIKPIAVPHTKTSQKPPTGSRAKTKKKKKKKKEVLAPSPIEPVQGMDSYIVLRIAADS